MSESRSQAGLPTSADLARYRIWDAYFTPAFSHPGADGVSAVQRDLERSQQAMERAGIERFCCFPHVGIGTTTDPELEQLLRVRPECVRRLLELRRPPLLGLIQLNVQDVAASSDAIQRWIADGPCVGVYFRGSSPGALPCTHPDAATLIEQTIAAGGIIVQHTWFRTGGKPHPGGSTPAELATVAARYPNQPFVCAHAGGEWERGLRAVRGQPNVIVETSGFDATAGFLEMAVRETGPARIVFGSHLPSRSLGTELGKVLGARLTDEERRLILGGNLRRLLRRSRAGARAIAE